MAMWVNPVAAMLRTSIPVGFSWLGYLGRPRDIFYTREIINVNLTLIGHLPLRVLAADLGGLRARWPDHDAFPDHIDHVVWVHGVQKENLVRLAGSENRSEEHT